MVGNALRRSGMQINFLAIKEWKAVKICIDGGRSRRHLVFGSLKEKENDVRTTIARHRKPLDRPCK